MSIGALEWGRVRIGTLLLVSVCSCRIRLVPFHCCLLRDLDKQHEIAMLRTPPRTPPHATLLPTQRDRDILSPTQQNLSQLSTGASGNLWQFVVLSPHLNVYEYWVVRLSHDVALMERFFSCLFKISRAVAKK